jgi:hypothetical protein
VTLFLNLMYLHHVYKMTFHIEIGHFLEKPRLEAKMSCYADYDSFFGQINKRVMLKGDNSA